MSTDTNQTAGAIPKTPFAFFWFVAKPFRKWMIVAVVFVVFASLLSQSSAYVFKLIVDAIEAGDHQAAMWYAVAYPALMFVVQMLYRASGVTGGYWSVYTKKNSYDVLTQYTLKHSHGYFINRFSGSLLSKINNVVSAVDQLIPELLWTYINTFVSFIVTFFFLLMIDPKAAIVFLMLLFVLIGFNRKLANRKAQLAKDAAEASTNLRARIVDVISNVQAVRQYVQRTEEESAIGNLSSAIRHTHKESWMYSEKMLFWNSCILFVFSLGMFWLLMTGWQTGEVTTGEVVLILALYSQITGALIFIGRAFNSTARTIGEMEEGLGELLVPYEIIDTPDSHELVATNAHIDWKAVSFAFAGKAVFENFSLHIPAGERVGLVGQSGAGKTTFVSLLLRQHELNAGSICINNHDIAKVTQDSLRKAIAVVPQEPALFHRTIRENILYGNSGATEEAVVDVAKKAQAHDFIMELPDGYETMVGERGIKLSGGQKQRIAIARAMLKDAPILVLDEATSALDSESEVAIQKALEVLMQGRTVIAIAHRLSTLRKMDRIIVLEKGQITEDGAHEKLVAEKGVYAKLWEHQAGGFLQDEV